MFFDNLYIIYSFTPFQIKIYIEREVQDRVDLLCHQIYLPHFGTQNNGKKDGFFSLRKFKMHSITAVSPQPAANN